MQYLERRQEPNPQLVATLEKELGLRREVCESMVIRGIDTVEKADSFLHPFIKNITPWQNYAGMVELKERIDQAIENGEKIVIFGDYDCDGICATTIMCLFLAKKGLDVSYYIPHRKKEGYGLNKEALEEIAEEMAPDLLITVDCGVTAIEEITYAQDVLGLEIVVTDHHEPMEELPECLIVNPKVSRGENCFNELCAAGIALRICEAVCGQEEMMQYADIATLATIADVVPLIDDNRIIANYGINIINSRARQSIKMLIDISVDDPNITLTAADIAFRLIPRINAIGRLADSSKAVQLFIDDDYFYAKSLAEQAHAINNERRQLTDELYRECLIKLEEYDLENNKIILLYSRGWESGVLGIVCAKLAEAFRRPTILLTDTDGRFKGSCRSIEGVNLYDALRATASYLYSYGGHAMACGLAIEEEKIPSFIMAINSFIERNGNNVFLPKFLYDIKVPLEELGLKIIEDMSVMEPFGAGNPQVAFLTDIGTIPFVDAGKIRHVKAICSDEFEVIGFDFKDKQKSLNAEATKYLIYIAREAVFRNKKFAQGMLMDFVVDYDTMYLDADYCAIKHLYQARFGDKSLFKPTIISQNEIENLLSKGIYGNVFLCYNVSTYNKFKSQYVDKLVYCSVGVVRDINPYNTLILDVDMVEKLNYYKRIIFLDKPCGVGMIDLLKLNMYCQVFYAEGADQGLSDNVATVSNVFPSVERMRIIFGAMREIILKNNIKRASELYSKIKEKNQSIGTIEFYVAFFALFELGIFKLKEKIVIDSEVKTSLDKSAIYSGIQSKIK